MKYSRDLSGKVSLVTGASKGIGYASALALAEAGSDVAIISRRKEELIEAAENIISKTGRKVIWISGDTADKKLSETAVTQIEKELGSVDILVNNSGGPPPGLFMDKTEEEWYLAIEQNFFSVVRFSRRVIPPMEKKRWGRIINITSTSVKEPMAGMVLSNATRAAVGAISKTMSLELSKSGITFNTVCPGPTYSDRAKYLIKTRCDNESITEEQVIKQISANVPVGRMAKPEEIGESVAFLASDSASYINGVVLPVDGGLTKSLY